MDWNKWKENYIEWARSVHTQVCQSVTSLSVCFHFLHLLTYVSQQGWKLILWSHFFVYSLFNFIYLFFPFLIRYTTSPHLFNKRAEEAFTRVRNKVCVHMLFEWIGYVVLKVTYRNTLGIICYTVLLLALFFFFSSYFILFIFLMWDIKVAYQFEYLRTRIQTCKQKFYSFLYLFLQMVASCGFVGYYWYWVLRLNSDCSWYFRLNSVFSYVNSWIIVFFVGFLIEKLFLCFSLFFFLVPMVCRSKCHYMAVTAMLMHSWLLDLWILLLSPVSR